MSVEITRHNDEFATAPQISPQDVAEIAKLGYRTIINNRPDGEAGATQPLNIDLAKAAADAGIGYYHLPVIRGQYSANQIAEMHEILGKSNKPVCSFCGSGARAAELYSLAIQHSND